MLLLRRVEPRVRPHELHLRARVHQLGAERERVRVPDHLRDRIRDDVAERALLRRRAGGHAGEVHGVLRGAEVLGQVLRGLRSRRLLEEHLRILRRELRVEVAVRGPEDQLVAVTNEARDGLLELRPDGDVLLERRLDLASELLLDVQPALVVRLRPAVVVVRAHIDPRHLERARTLLGARRSGRRRERENGEAGAREKGHRADGLPSAHRVRLLRE